MNQWFPTFRRFSVIWPWYTTSVQSQSLLRLIAVATEENLPLAPLLQSWAADERGAQQKRLLRLAGLLAGGMPLGEAIEAVPHVLGDQELLAIRFDSKLGARTAAVREALREPPALNAPWKGDLFYFFTVLIVGLALIGFTYVAVVPRLSRILDDFSIAQPQVYALSRSLANAAHRYWVPLGLLFFAALWLAYSTPMGRLVRRAAASRLSSSGSELIAADVLQKLALASTAGRPLSGALSTLARYHFDPLMRHKLLFVRNEVEQGVDIWQSLTAVGLLAPADVRLLETAERVGNRPWALAQLAQVRKTRAQRRSDWLSTILLPALVLVLALLVIFQAFSVLVPLTEILQSL